jgi:hypothetical protein
LHLLGVDVSEKDKILHKSYLKGISLPINDQLLDFFNEMNDFITELKEVRYEFLKYEIGFCNEIIKNLILSF